MACWSYALDPYWLVMCVRFIFFFDPYHFNFCLDQVILGTILGAALGSYLCCLFH